VDSVGRTSDTTSSRTLEDLVRAEYQLTYHDVRVLLSVVLAIRTKNTPGHITEDRN